MFDTLPFPNITAKDAEERSKQTVDYLIQFKEELEFILNAIVNGEYEKVTTRPIQMKEEVESIVNSSANNLTITEVINSAAFHGALDGVREEIPKEYLVSAEQTYVSDEPGGINLYSIKDASGTIHQFQVKNGEKGEKGDSPSLNLSVDYETGELKYTSS